MATPAYGRTAMTKWQFGKEVSAGTNVTVTYAPVVTGDPTLETSWEDIPHDPNQFESKVLPVKTGEGWTLPLTGAANFQELPLWFLTYVKGGVSPTGTNPRTWTFTPSQTTDDLDTWTVEYGQNLYGWKGNFVTGRELTLSFDESGGFWNLSADLMGRAFGSNTMTGGIEQIASPSPLLGAYTKVFIDDTAGNIGTTQVSLALRRGTVTFGWEAVEPKLLSGTGFEYDAIGRGQRITTVSLTFEQTSATQTEILHYLRNHVTTSKARYVRLTVDGNIITGGREKLTLDLPGTWREAAFERIGQNAVWTVTGQVKYDSTLTYGLKAVVVNNVASY